MKYSISIIICCSTILFICACGNSCTIPELTVFGNDSVLSEVDLGLSVKWANMNLDAERPEEFGKFYALGSVQAYDSIPDDFILKITINRQEWQDSLCVVLPKYDAASYQTGNKWRIPTVEEWIELGQKCKWRWVSYHEVEGYHIVGPNGNSIFLPAAGNTESKYGDKPNGYYRSSDVFDGGATFSVYFTKPENTNSPIINLNEDMDCSGNVYFYLYGIQVPASIRPVRTRGLSLNDTIMPTVVSQHFTSRIEKGNLVIYTPDYTNIDLVCGTMPSQSDSSVIFCAEAAFTRDLLKDFDHSNVFGDHVCSGTRHKGVGSKRNTGAFVYYQGTWKFLYKEYSKELDDAARNGGMGFCQEMMIHNSKRVPTIRKDSNKNEFRALCELEGKICVIDSKGVAAFGDFIQALLNEGVSEALYLDMGIGWNYSWWRDRNGATHEIHDKIIPYTTNWITFFK